MNAAEKKKFRHSDEWKNFRQKMRRMFYKTDPITLEPLMRDWELHHMCLDSSQYTDLSNTSRFKPLNKKTHEAIHTLYRIYKKDKGVLERVQQLLETMLEINRRK